MQRYFLDLKFDGESPIDDEKGVVIPDMESAQIEAALALSDFAKGMVLNGRLTHSLAVIVRDEFGPVLQATLNYELKRLN